MLYKDKNGSYTSDYLLDGEFTREMENNSNRVKNMNEVFDNYNLDNEDRDFWGDNYPDKDIDNFVDKLFSNDPFEEGSLDLENEEYEGFDPTTVPCGEKNWIKIIRLFSVRWKIIKS
ncbi:hypothetical protein [Brachyspira murdochii]|uniref:hypothetical protein n=1 Tax=Brachyspira murdochii TaxID=84378 RepID=UPI0012F4A044|nr:hypothetical protein [Brachyspira murdochii]